MAKYVLIVDDAPNIVLSLEFLMRKEGYEVLSVSNGEEAMGAIAEKIPDLVLLDEPESGVDLESIALVGEAINSLLYRGVKCPQEKPHKEKIAGRTKSALVITHTGHILDYITADKGQVLYNGILCCAKNARDILKWIREYGYEECVRCSNEIKSLI